MTNRPILFSAPMVRAILEGRKTVTRRVVKRPPPFDAVYSDKGDLNGVEHWFLDDKPSSIDGYRIRCPYGQPGDLLWVRETFASTEIVTECGTKMRGLWHRATHEDFLADIPEGGTPDKWKPSIHMPRWASRITLEVTGVRVERLHDITENQAQAEGCAPSWLDAADGETVHAHRHPTYLQGFARLWRDINGAVSFDANPWVWVVEFKVNKPTNRRHLWDAS